jgi:Actin like proteins N terminal domain
MGHRPTYYLGVDEGNRTTVVSRRDADGLNEIITIFPSFIAPISLEEQERFSSGLNAATPFGEGEYLLSSEGIHFYVGKLALRQGSKATDARGAANRYWTEHNRNLLRASIAACIPLEELEQNGAYNPSTNAYEFEVRVATGLPVTLYDLERAELIRQAFTGIHTYTFNKRNYIVHVLVGPVVMEGTGGLVLYGSALAKKGVIDIGYWSTEIIVMEGGRPVREGSAGDEIGVGDAADILKAEVMSAFKRELSDDEVRDILLAQARHQELPPITAYGKALPEDRLCVMAESALGSTGSRLKTLIASTWSSVRGYIAADINPVMLVGGGPYYLERYVREVVPHARMPIEPENANARAYSLIAIGYKKWNDVAQAALVAR